MNKQRIEDVYTNYYLSQAGSGFSTVYSGPVFQKGQGIGSFLGGLFRSLLPILKNGSAIVGNEILKSGANIISDIANCHDPQQTIKKRGKETINNLGKIVGDKMFGSGYKSATMRKRSHSQSDSQSAKKRKTSARSTNNKKKNKSKPKTKLKNSTKSNKKSVNRSKNEILDIFS